MTRHRTRARRIPLLTALLLALTLSGLPAAARAEGASRLYFLASDAGFRYWSVQAHEPDASVTRSNVNCARSPAFAYDTSCSTNPAISALNQTVVYTTTIVFYQHSLLLERLTWSDTEPLKFHVELDVAQAPDIAPPTVALRLQNSKGSAESPSFAQVAPGVWEGELRSTGAAGKQVTPFGNEFDSISLLVRSPSISRSIDVLLGGRSYIELPRPVAAASIAALDASGPRETERLSTTQRTFGFNDDHWDVRTYEGDLTAKREFEFTLDETAEILFAWVEGWDVPFTYSAARRGATDPRTATDAPFVHFARPDGSSFGSAPGTTRGRGSDSTAALKVPAGTYAFVVEPLGYSQGHPYTAYVLTAGARTLGSMRWRTIPNGPIPPTRVPSGAAACGGLGESVPTTSEVASFAYSVSWDSLTPQKWAPVFMVPLKDDDTSFGQDFSCGLGTGTRVRLTRPVRAVWGVGVTPSRDATTTHAYDVSVEMYVAYTYRPA